MNRARLWCVIVGIAMFLPAKGASAATRPQADSGPGTGLTTRNPLDEIKDELVRVLADAGVPFTSDQENSITLVLEESRRASEQLFGDVMDFRSGPPQGETLDRARAGIAWMNEDFSQRVRQYLDPEQLEVWDAHVEEQGSADEGTPSTAGSLYQLHRRPCRGRRFPFDCGRRGRSPAAPGRTASGNTRS
jgi:hypothetical protein